MVVEKQGTAAEPFGVIESRSGTPEDLERAGLDQVFDCWRRWAGDKPAPAWRDVRLLDLPARLISGVMVADAVPESPGDFRIRYWGTGLVEAFGIEISGRRVSEVEHFGVLNAFLEDAPRLLKTGAPQIRVSRIVGTSGVARQLCTLRLPLAANGVDVDGVITVDNVIAPLLEPLPWVI